MAKGDNKRRTAGVLFQKGASGRQQTSHDVMQPGPSSAPDFTPEPSAMDPRVPNLRCRKQPERRQNEEDLGNRIVHLNSVIMMMNAIFRAHQNFPDHCETLDMELHKERKVGLGSDLQMRCKTCCFMSSTYRTYKPCVGKKTGASINLMLASALQDTPIGAGKANLLLSSMDIPPPSCSHLQNLISAAAKKTVTLNEKDMEDKRQQVVQHNREHGMADPKQLDLSFDCRYNSTRMVSSYKPGQAASQAYGVAIENHTSYKYIVGLAIENKLCWTGAYLRNKGYDVTCPGGHLDCTANLSYMEPHSERQMAREIARKMHEDNIMIKTLTTDGDTRSHLGLQDFYDDLGAAWSADRQADPYHLGSSQIRRVRKADWGKTMFPKFPTRQARQGAITALGKDIKSRCSAIISKLKERGGGDLRKIILLLPEVCSATVECYAGNCSFCPHRSLVCNGVGGPGHWWFDSQYLPTHNIDSLKMTKTDKELMKTIIEVRLSEKAVLSVASDTSTQKCEAFNRGVLSTLPKEVNFSRNFVGKLASKTLQLNNSVQSSVQTKVRALTGRDLSPRAIRYLRYCSRKTEIRKKQQQTTQFKIRRNRTRARLEHEYHRARSGTHQEEEYLKGQMD